MSQFAFLQAEFPGVFEAAAKAEAAAVPDPPHRLLLRPPRRRAARPLGVQARPGARAAVPGQHQQPGPRTDVPEGGLGVFARGLVGLDREAAKKAFGGFLAGGTHTACQIEFVDLVIDHLCE